MGSAIFRRPSLRRRTGSADSTASRSEKVPQSPPPALPVELRATTSNTSSNAAAPASVAVAAAPVAAPVSNSSSTGRFARLFGRRKSISSPTNFTHLTKPDLVADPVPVLQEASYSINKQSPPLAVISAGWQDSAGPIKALADTDRPVSPRTVSHADVAPAANAQLSVDDATTRSKTVDSQSSKASAFTFPARASLSNDSDAKANSAQDPLRSRQAKHSTSRSLPLTSLPISNPVSWEASTDSTDASAIPIPQRRPSKPGRSLSLSHRKSSKSLSMIGSIFGGSIGAQTPSTSSSPPLPQAAATLTQRYPPSENRTSQTVEASTSSHSRRPSLRARLKMGRSTTEQLPQRPTTPEIESWKQKSHDPVDVGSADTRASIDGPSRPKPAESPVKITRSKSMIRRKPPPEIKQEEIDSSSSTPVYSRTFRTLEVDHYTGSPLGGSPASSPEAQFSALAGTSPKSATHVPVSASHDVPYKPSRSQSSQIEGLGLIGASSASTDMADASVPSIDVRLSTPPRDQSPVVAAAMSSNDGAKQKLAPNASPSVGGRRLSSGMQSVADTSLSVDRPWSLISAGEADTPLLKLRKLVVDTNASDDSRDDDDASDRLFFRPLHGASQQREEATPSTDKMMEAIEKAEVISEGEAEQLRSSSQTTTRSDTKHEIASVHSSGSSTLRAARSVAAQPSISGLSAASGALSEASQASTVRMRNMPASLSQAVEPLPAAPIEVADREADSIGPLPGKSPAASQHSFRTRQHRRDSSTGSAYSQSTVQQARRASTASRITARSSGHWSESRLSEDALSALEAEVGQARRAEVIALGKGRVKDWVADRPLPTTEAPTLSRSNTLRKKAQQSATAATIDNGSETVVNEREAQRQKALNEQLSRKLQQLSDAQLEADAPSASDVEIRDIPDEESHAPSPRPVVESAETRSAVPRFARLSAFHDRKLLGEPQGAATQPSSQMVEEAIRLGRAPSKRVRRSVSEARSAGEAVMAEREPVGTTAPRRVSGSSTAASLAAARQRRRSASSKRAASSADVMNPTLVPAVPAAPLLAMQDVVASSEDKEPASDKMQEDSKQHSKQRSYATSEEAARAKQRELVEREKRQAEKEAKRQTQLQQKYARKKQSDPLLATRLALAGLQPPVEAMPKLRAEQVAGSTPAAAAPAFRTSMFTAGLQVPEVPERRASAGSPALLSAPMARKNSIAGSVTSFHTALDVPAEPSAVVSAAASPLTSTVEPAKEAGDASFTSKDSEVRPDTSYSIASSLAVDFEFPVPPQRMKEQLSEDGTLLSRAGLQESPEQQQWRERGHYLPAVASQRMQTPPRDSSLRHRSPSQGTGMVASRTLPQLGAVSPLDSVKQSVALRRSRSVGYNSRDMRRMTREQMKLDADRHPSPKSSHAALPATGLGIELDEAGGRRYSNANSGAATPSTVVGMHRQPIAA